MARSTVLLATGGAQYRPAHHQPTAVYSAVVIVLTIGRLGTPTGTGVHRPNHRWLDPAPGYKPHHRGKRNRRVQPPRRASLARVPPVRRSVDPTEPDETAGAPPRRLLT